MRNLSINEYASISGGINYFQTPNDGIKFTQILGSVSSIVIGGIGLFNLLSPINTTAQLMKGIIEIGVSLASFMFFLKYFKQTVEKTKSQLKFF